MKEFLKKLTDLGIPVILLRDPFTKLPGVSFTILVLSVILMIAGILSNWLWFFKGVDGSLATTFLGMSMGLYWGRKVSSSGKGNIEIDK